MERRTLLLGAAAAGTTALAGCLSTAQSAGSGGSDTRTITVTGSADERAEPDRAVLDVSIEATGDSASSVRDELSTQSAQLNQALLDAGLDEEQITTGRFSIREERQPPRDDEPDTPERTVYYGTYTFTIDIDTVAETGEIIDVAIDAGADSVDRIEYTLSEATRSDLRDSALRQAVADARAEADVLAAEVDTTIVGVQHVNSAGGGFSPAYDRFDVEAADAGGSTELQPGDVTVSATVEVTYRIS